MKALVRQFALVHSDKEYDAPLGLSKALAYVRDTQGTDEANEAQLAMGAARKEFNEARHEMNVLLEELEAEL